MNEQLYPSGGCWDDHDPYSDPILEWEPDPPTFTGFDGKPYTHGDRVEIHPGTDQWMRGARFGTVVASSSTPKDRVHVELDRIPGRTFAGREDTFRRA